MGAGVWVAGRAVWVEVGTADESRVGDAVIATGLAGWGVDETGTSGRQAGSSKLAVIIKERMASQRSRNRMWSILLQRKNVLLRFSRTCRGESSYILTKNIKKPVLSIVAGE